MIVAVVNFALPAPLSLQKAQEVFEASAPSYEAVPGLLRKHYLLSEDGLTAGGVYLWESRAHADALYTTAWSARVASRYGTAPTVSFFHSPVTVHP
jgi:hypothetical protein